MVTTGERMAAMPAAASRRGVECAVTTAERAVAAESAMPTMPAANFDLQVVGNDTAVDRIRIEQGRRLGAPAGDDRQRQEHRKSESEQSKRSRHPATENTTANVQICHV